MGQKVNPIGMRVGIIRGWDSKWYADKNAVAKFVEEDIKIRKYLTTFYKNAAVSHVEIERIKSKAKDRVIISVFTAKPGVVVGREAETKKKVAANLEKMTNKEIVLNVFEIKHPERVASLVAQSMAEQLENRASFRRVQKIAIQRALKLGAKGVRTLVSGRLGGAEMARSEGYSEGQVPLHTLRADIDYAVAEAQTTYGKLGIKVWIYQGEVLPGQTRESIVLDPSKRNEARPNKERAPRPRPGDKNPRAARDNKGGK